MAPSSGQNNVLEDTSTPKRNPKPVDRYDPSPSVRAKRKDPSTPQKDANKRLDDKASPTIARTTTPEPSSTSMKTQELDMMREMFQKLLQKVDTMSKTIDSLQEEVRSLKSELSLQSSRTSDEQGGSCSYRQALLSTPSSPTLGVLSSTPSSLQSGVQLPSIRKPANPLTGETLVTIEMRKKPGCVEQGLPREQSTNLRKKIDSAMEAIGLQTKIVRFMWLPEDQQLRFAVSKEAESKLRDNDAWIPQDFNIRGREWHSFTLHFVPEWALFDQDGALRADLKDEIAEENNITVEKIRLLRSTGKVQSAQISQKKIKHGPIVVHCRNKDDVLRMLSGREEIKVFGVSLSPRPYIKNFKRKHCYNCQGYGHVSTQCNNVSRCRHCGGVGHKECRAAQPSCFNCGGNHPASDTTCPRFQLEIQQQMNEDSNELDANE